MMDSPQKSFDLLPKEDITFLATASTEDQCHRTIFKKIVAFIESSPFFSSYDDRLKYTSGRLEFPGKLVVLGLGSNLKGNVGLTVKVFVAEEINFTGESTYKVSPSALYNKLSKSTITFKPFKEDIKVAISSQANGTDFLSNRMALVKEQKLESTLSINKDTLELNPNLTQEHLNDEKLMDEDSYNLEFGFGAGRDGISYFKQVTLDKLKKWKMPNIFDGNPKFGLRHPFSPDLRIDRLVYDRNAVEYGIFSDPASIGDGFGLTLAHLDLYNMIIIDGITVFKSPKGEEIDPNLIRLMIRKIIKVVPVETYNYDIYMYNEIRDEVRDLGIQTNQKHLRLPEWEALKERINTDRIKGPYLDYLYAEAEGLIKSNNKVIHQSGGSKDMIDSVCQTVALWDDPDREDNKIDENQMIVAKGVRTQLR